MHFIHAVTHSSRHSFKHELRADTSRVARSARVVGRFYSSLTFVTCVLVPAPARPRGRSGRSSPIDPIRRSVLFPPVMHARSEFRPSFVRTVVSAAAGRACVPGGRAGPVRQANPKCYRYCQTELADPRPALRRGQNCPLEVMFSGCMVLYPDQRTLDSAERTNCFNRTTETKCTRT